jgi:uncharacterized protein YbbK (DUF523 family)
MTDEIRIGVSACLLGEPVRYDGNHKRDSFVADVLARFVHLVPVCPEVEIGLGTPREPIHLERGDDRLRLVGAETGRDLTETMNDYARRKLDELSLLDLSGYILKRSSPSCGADRVPVHGPRGRVVGSGRGLFAEALRSRWPLLPIEEEDRLADPHARDAFLDRVFSYHRQRRSA